jgi:hypothetical protein
MAMKERALARTTPPGTSPRRYNAPDTLLAFLNDLSPRPPDRPHYAALPTAIPITTRHNQRARHTQQA